MDGNTRDLIAFQCRLCPWHGMLPVEEMLSDEEINTWFECPVHGSDQTEINRIRYAKFRDDRRKRRGS